MPRWLADPDAADRLADAAAQADDVAAICTPAGPPPPADPTDPPSKETP